MRYYVFASDYDGTLANDGKVNQEIIDKLTKLRSTGRLPVLVTGREMKYLIEDFPDYKIFDHIVAENGALLHETATGKEELLGPAADRSFVNALVSAGVKPLSVGKVIVATWKPHESVVLKIIRDLGIERQVIFNKEAVMVLPAGINKATGLKALLDRLKFSAHNVVAIGDAENDSAMIQFAECGVAVANALPALKNLADYVTGGARETGVSEMIDQILTNDLEDVDGRVTRHNLELGQYENGDVYSIRPYRNGMLVSGISGGGKTTFTLSIIESLVKKSYQFCLIDPEGDYLEMEGALVLGNERSVPSVEELMLLMKQPEQNLVICILSVPLLERPAYFVKFMLAFSKLRLEAGHPHWLLLDEAHHLIPAAEGPDSYPTPEDFANFILISTTPDNLDRQILEKTDTIMVVGKDSHYPIEQYCKSLHIEEPAIPQIEKGEICVWNRHTGEDPFIIRFNIPQKLLQRHKRKYAEGNMDYNSFVFTGPENKLKLVASNLILFKHLAEGIDEDTWNYHLLRGDFENWFRDKVHDDELAEVSNEAARINDSEISRRRILDYINEKYTAG
jgi:hydroxymethylpyrimidine pyrophosphatase-like HAD family hydrolase